MSGICFKVMEGWSGGGSKHTDKARLAMNGHEFEQAPGDGEGQDSLVCFSPWDCKELDTT